MRIRTIALAGCATAALVAGCKKTDDSATNYTKAINTYYASRPECLWSQPKKFPVQANTSDTNKTSDYDALVDQGLLTRTTGEKKELIIISKQVTNYDLSDKGRGAWTADQSQPGFGNFCYGTPNVSTIDSSTANNGQPGATATVTYHATMSGAPDWAKAAETQNAFPQVKADLAAPIAGTATLTDTNNGWAVTKGPKAASSVDGSIVQ